MVDLELAAKSIENLRSKKCNLAFVGFLVIVEAIAANAVAGRAFDHGDFNYRMRIRLAAVMAKKIVAGRNVKATNFHWTQSYHR